MAMTSGKADPMKLYMGGKLKISGDLMASQKLTFLQKIDPQARAARPSEEARGAAAAAPAAARPRRRRRPGRAAARPTCSPPSRTTSRATPDIVGRVGKTFVFKLTSPDSAWTVDVKNGKGSVDAGAIDKADMHAGAGRRGLPRR